LLCRPHGSRVFSHIEMHHATSIVRQYNENMSTLKVAVGTVKKSIPAMALASLVKNAFHVEEGGPFFWIRYLSTVAWQAVIPSLASSLIIRGVPQKGFAWLIVLINLRISLPILGRPGFCVPHRRVQNSRNRFCCQSVTVRGRANFRNDFHWSLSLE